MAIDDVYMMRVVFTNADTAKDLSFGLHGRQPGAPAPSVDALEDDVVAWWNTDLGAGAAQKTFHDADTSLVRVTLRRVDPDEPVEFQNTDGLPIAGTLAGDQYAGQASILVSLRTGLIGRSYRGRAYLPPPGEAVVGANGALSNADALVMAENFQTFLATLVVDGFQPAIFSQFKKNPAPPPVTIPRVPPISTDIESVYVDRLLRTQRRRQDRRPVYAS